MLLLTQLYVAILVPAAIMIAVAAVFAVLLAFLGRKLEVKRDEKVVEVESLLSGANCGGCGFAGCSAFAEALANGKADLSACNATSKVNKDKIAAILGTVNEGEEMSFVVCCNGGSACEDKYDYPRRATCSTMPPKAVICVRTGQRNKARGGSPNTNGTTWAMLRTEQCIITGRNVIIHKSTNPTTAGLTSSCGAQAAGKIIEIICVYIFNPGHKGKIQIMAS